MISEYTQSAQISLRYTLFQKKMMILDAFGVF